MRVFIVAGSPQAERPIGLTPGPGDRVIAADSGAVHARAWGWPVHLLVGDLDSAPPAEVTALVAAGTPLLTAAAAKEETDLELALARGLADGATEIILCAALGGRADHTLANVLLLARPELAGLDVRIVEGGQTIRLLRSATTDGTVIARSGVCDEAILSDARDCFGAAAPRNDRSLVGGRQSAVAGQAGHLSLTGTRGDLLSLLPIGGDAVGVTTAGLAYPLRDETLFFGQARGVSNVFEGEEAEVWLREGMLLVVQTTDGRPTTEDRRKTDDEPNE